MILKTVRLYIASIQFKLGWKIRIFGNRMALKGERTRNHLERLEAEKYFKAFRDSSNHGKEIITIIEDDDLGPIYKN